MFLNELYEATYKPILPRNEQKIDPWKMSFSEYYDIANPSRKHHDSESYDFDVSDLNDEWAIKSLQQMKLLGSKNLKGIQVDFYGGTEDRRKMDYADKDFDANAHFAKSPYVYSFKAVDHDSGNIIGIAQDEWGALLISVAREYRAIGIGQILGEYARTYKSHYDSGGMTYNGKINFKKVYSKFVSDAMRQGKYTAAVKNGEMSAERAKEIIASADIKKVKSPLSTSDEWKSERILIAGINGMFIIYDSKLLRLFKDGHKNMPAQDGQEHPLAERFLYGAAYAGGGYHADGALRIFTFGGNSTKIKLFLMNLLLADASQNNENLIVPNELMQFVDKDKVESIPHRYDRNVTLLKPVAYNFSIDAIVTAEKKLRKQFDPYDEFANWISEKAVADFDVN